LGYAPGMLRGSRCTATLLILAAHAWVGGTVLADDPAPAGPPTVEPPAVVRESEPSRPKAPPGSWKGRSKDDLVKAFGRPSSIRPDGKGGQICIYAENIRHETGSNYAFEPAWRAAGSSAMREDYPKEIHVESKALATFWINADNVIYDERFKPNALKKIGRSVALP
jgi:hypothetical protein